MTEEILRGILDVQSGTLDIISNHSVKICDIQKGLILVMIAIVILTIWNYYLSMKIKSLKGEKT